MILTVDIGNTNIKVGGWAGEELAFIARLQTNALRTQDEYALDLLNLIRVHEHNPARFDGAIISSVVPQLSPVFKDAAERVTCGKQVFLLSPELYTGLDIATDSPGTLGTDMICSAVAAIEKYPLPCIVINMGTATTVAAIDMQGRFLGCAICPGVRVSMDALSKKAAQLPYISLEAPPSVIGRNSVDSMKSGAIFGTAGTLDGISARMKKIVGEEATIVACGGLAGSVIDYCTQTIIRDDDLVLEGLRLIYHRNAK